MTHYINIRNDKKVLQKISSSSSVKKVMDIFVIPRQTIFTIRGENLIFNFAKRGNHSRRHFLICNNVRNTLCSRWLPFLYISAGDQQRFKSLQNKSHFQSLRTHHAYSTLKRHGNGHFRVVSKWNTRGAFLGMLILKKRRICLVLLMLVINCLLRIGLLQLNV